MIHLNNPVEEPIKRLDPIITEVDFLELRPMTLWLGYFWMRLPIEYLVVYPVVFNIIGQFIWVVSFARQLKIDE
jgi:hypothetical protein